MKVLSYTIVAFIILIPSFDRLAAQDITGTCLRDVNETITNQNRISICTQALDDAKLSVKKRAAFLMARSKAYYLSNQYDLASKDITSGLELTSLSDLKPGNPTAFSLTAMDLLIKIQQDEKAVRTEAIEFFQKFPAHGALAIKW